MNCIVAVDKNWNIGINGELLVRNPLDMKYFKSITMGNIVVMGRKTLESFPGGKPLKGRINIVLTRNQGMRDDVLYCHNVPELLELLEQYKNKPVFVIGGGIVYRLLLPYCEKAYITYMYNEYEADTDFPNLDDMPQWQLTEESDPQQFEDIRFTFRIYTRILPTV